MEKMRWFLKLHGILVGNSATRIPQRRLARYVKNQIGLPDAYGDLIRVARRSNIRGILDIGSFVGDTVQCFVDEVKSVPIYAFEPTPTSYSILKQRFVGIDNVIPCNYALSNSDRDMDFFENKNPQTNSLLENDEGNEASFSEFTSHLQMIKIKAITIDNWIKSNGIIGPLIIKADMQGAEGLLLAGGEEAFTNHVVAFFSEVQVEPMYRGQASFSEMHEVLSKRYGFVLRNVYPCFHDRDGRATQFDCLWVKPHVLSALR